MRSTSNSPDAKKFKGFPAFILLAVIFGLQSCTKDKCETTYSYVAYDPVYKNINEIRGPLQSLPAKNILKPGKIWIQGNYLFVNELNQGIHIINNSDPSNPQPVSFISIPGNVDMAVKGNTLYADNYMDLLAIDISNPNAVQLSKRVENVFPGFIMDGNNIIVDYLERIATQTEEVDCGSGYSKGGPFLFDTNGGGMTLQAGSGAGAGGGDSKPSLGGSMARFTLYSDYLYIVDNANLQLYNIASPSAPVKANEVNLGWGIETIFPYKDNLFIGSNTGMFIYTLTNPSQPKYLSEFTHANSCDPVVVEGDYAYVTLRSGNSCAGISNQLDVIDIKNLKSPKLVKSYQMSNPYGLGIDKGILFICDGTDGLKVYNAVDPAKIGENRLGHYSGFESYDVIPWNKHLIMTTKNGIYQYNYSNPSELQLLSTIPTGN